MVHPASERETSRWLRRDSASAELLQLDGDRKALRRKTLERIGDLLWRHRAAIQRELFNRERALLDIPTPSPSTILPTFTTTATRRESSPASGTPGRSATLVP